MNNAALYQLIIGLVVGGIIYYVSTVTPPEVSPIVRFIGGIVIVLTVLSFLLVLLGFSPLFTLGR